LLVQTKEETPRTTHAGIFAARQGVAHHRRAKLADRAAKQTSTQDLSFSCATEGAKDQLKQFSLTPQACGQKLACRTFRSEVLPSKEQLTLSYLSELSLSSREGRHDNHWHSLT